MCLMLQLPTLCFLTYPRSVSEAHGRLEYARDVATAFEARPPCYHTSAHPLTRLPL